MLRNTNNREKLYLVTLGDLVHGELTHHMDFAKTMEDDIMTQSLKTSSYIVDFLVNLMSTFDTIEIHSVVGNHGRMPGQRRMPNHGAGNSFDWLVMDFVEREWRTIELDPTNNIEPGRVTFNNCKSEWYNFSIENFKVSITHGHRLGIGSYGVREKMFGKFNVLRAKDGQIIDALLHGHFHHNTLIEFPHGKFQVGGGSLVGPDPYAMNTLQAASEPSQTLVRLRRNSDGDLEFDGIKAIRVGVLD